MAYRHDEGYRDRDDCEIVAGADPVRENAEAFTAEFDVADAAASTSPSTSTTTRSKRWSNRVH